MSAIVIYIVGHWFLAYLTVAYPIYTHLFDGIALAFCTTILKSSGIALMKSKS